LSEVVKELSRLIQEIVNRRESRPSSSSSSGIELELELEAELHRANENLEKVQRHLDDREEELKRRAEQVMELTSKVQELIRLSSSPSWVRQRVFSTPSEII
jgi:predicted nuclease with TOPRIM domain